MTEFALQMRRGILALGLSLAAGITMLLMTRIDVIHYAPQKPLYLGAGIVLVLASFGALWTPLSLIGQILLWNGTGWCIGLAVFGLESVGSLPLWPLMLAALALTFWPRTPETTLPPIGIAISLLGGFGVCWLGGSERSLPFPTEWITG